MTPLAFKTTVLAYQSLAGGFTGRASDRLHQIGTHLSVYRASSPEGSTTPIRLAEIRRPGGVRALPVYYFSPDNGRSFCRVSTMAGESLKGTLDLALPDIPPDLARLRVDQVRNHPHLTLPDGTALPLDLVNAVSDRRQLESMDHYRGYPNSLDPFFLGRIFDPTGAFQDFYLLITKPRHITGRLDQRHPAATGNPGRFQLFVGQPHKMQQWSITSVQRLGQEGTVEVATPAGRLMISLTGDRRIHAFIPTGETGGRIVEEVSSDQAHLDLLGIHLEETDPLHSRTRPRNPRQWRHAVMPFLEVIDRFRQMSLELGSLGVWFSDVEGLMVFFNSGRVLAIDDLVAIAVWRGSLFLKSYPTGRALEPVLERFDEGGNLETLEEREIPPAIRPQLAPRERPKELDLH